LDSIRLAEDSFQRRGLAKTTLNLRVPQNVANFLTVYQTTIFSRWLLFLGVGRLVSGWVSRSIGTRIGLSDMTVWLT